MKKFMVQFESEELGQVVCMTDENNEDCKEEVRFYFDPEHEELSVCSVFIASEVDGFAQETLNKLTEEIVFEYVRNAKSKIREALTHVSD